MRAQVAVAVRSHIRHFGDYPRGFWLPECGYYAGVEEFLREQDLRYTFLEAHGILFADRRPRYGVYAPVACPNKVAAFGRDPESARAGMVLRGRLPGRPGLPGVLPRHRLRAADRRRSRPFLPDGDLRMHTGIKYWAITSADGEKALYNRKAALKKVEEHAEAFVRTGCATPSGCARTWTGRP